MGLPASWTTAHQQPPDSTRDVPWLAEVQEAPASIPANIPQLSPLLVDSRGLPIESLAGWRRRRAEIRAQWNEIIRPLPIARPDKPEWTVLEQDRIDGIIRQRIRYETEPGQFTEAYLLRPERLEAPVPGVAVFHSTVAHSIRQPAGLAEDVQKAFGLKLARRGMVTLSPRNFLWPNNEQIAAQAEVKKFLERHPQSTGMARMLFDAQLAVDLLLSLPEVDGQRIGSVGHSLGAKEVLYLAAFDERVKVTVSSEGGIGIPYSNWDAPWYLGEQVHQEAFAHEHHELLALAAPRPFLLIGGDSADGAKSWPFIEAALPIYNLHGAPPRLGLFNHRQGHAVPPIAEERIDQWMTTYLA